MSWIQISLRIAAGTIILFVIACGFFYYAASKSSQKKSHMIDDLAKVPIGSTVVDVMKLSRELGFKLDSNEFAIPSVVEVQNEDSQQMSNGLPEMVNKDTDLSKFRNGTLNFGLSLSFKDCTLERFEAPTTDSFSHRLVFS